MKKNVIVLVCLLFLSGTVFSKTLFYRSTRKKTETIITVRETKDARTGMIKSSSVTKFVTHNFQCNEKCETINWELINSKKGINITAQRKNNNVLITGYLSQKPVNKEIKLDELPWHQNMTLALSHFVKTGTKSTQYWVLNPDDFKPYKLVAYRQNVETIQINNTDVKAVNILVTLPGTMSSFWHSNYWFRESDGIYIKDTDDKEMSELIEEKTE